MLRQKQSEEKERDREREMRRGEREILGQRERKRGEREVDGDRESDRDQERKPVNVDTTTVVGHVIRGVDQCHSTVLYFICLPFYFLTQAGRGYIEWPLNPGPYWLTCLLAKIL